MWGCDVLSRGSWVRELILRMSWIPKNNACCLSLDALLPYDELGGFGAQILYPARALVPMVCEVSCKTHREDAVNTCDACHPERHDTMGNKVSVEWQGWRVCRSRPQFSPARKYCTTLSPHIDMCRSLQILAFCTRARARNTSRGQLDVALSRRGFIKILHESFAWHKV